MEPSLTLRPRQLTLKPIVMRSGECDSFLALMVELKLNFLVFVVKIIPHRHIHFGLPNTCFSFCFLMCLTFCLDVCWCTIFVPGNPRD